MSTGGRVPTSWAVEYWPEPSWDHTDMECWVCGERPGVRGVSVEWAFAGGAMEFICTSRLVCDQCPGDLNEWGPREWRLLGDIENAYEAGVIAGWVDAWRRLPRTVPS